MAQLEIVVALSDNFVIGVDGQIPWHLSEDLKHFKEITTSHPVIMGRRTFESIGSCRRGFKGRQWRQSDGDWRCQNV